jgi:hypothetical protein
MVKTQGRTGGQKSCAKRKSFLRRNIVFEQIGTDLNKLKRLKTLLNTGENQKNAMK